MNIKLGISVFGWLVYIIVAAITLDSVITSYRETSTIEWLPLAVIVGCGIFGLFIQWLPDSGRSGGSGGGNGVTPPSSGWGSDGGCDGGSGGGC